VGPLKDRQSALTNFSVQYARTGRRGVSGLHFRSGTGENEVPMSRMTYKGHQYEPVGEEHWQIGRTLRNRHRWRQRHGLALYPNGYAYENDIDSSLDVVTPRLLQMGDLPWLR
jgi:hypothetical protein